MKPISFILKYAVIQMFEYFFCIKLIFFCLFLKFSILNGFFSSKNPKKKYQFPEKY